MLPSNTSIQSILLLVELGTCQRQRYFDVSPVCCGRAVAMTVQWLCDDQAITVMAAHNCAMTVQSDASSVQSETSASHTTNCSFVHVLPYQS